MSNKKNILKKSQIKLYFVSGFFILAYAAIHNFRDFGHRLGADTPSVFKGAIDDLLVLLVFMAGYIAQRMLSYFSEAAIEIHGEDIIVNNNSYIKITNEDKLSHPDVKIFFELYQESLDKSGKMLIEDANVSIGSISQLNDMSTESILWVKVPEKISKIAVNYRNDYTTHLDVKVTSVHRFTNFRGLSTKRIRFSALK